MWCALLVAAGIVLAWPLGDSPAADHPFAGGPGAPPAAVTAPSSEGLLVPLRRALLQLQIATERRVRRSLQELQAPGASGLVAALALAFVYGAIHAAGPGHGKFVIASCLLARESRWWHAGRMAIQFSLTHTASAVVLLGVADLAVRAAIGGSPEGMRAVRLISYGMTALLGTGMLVRVVRRTRQDPARVPPDACCAPEPRVSSRGMIAVAAGLVPCTGATLIMLYAVANDVFWTGIGLVAAVGAGMTTTLTAVGALAVAGRRVALRPWTAGGRRWRATLTLEFAGALSVLGVSLLLLMAAL